MSSAGTLISDLGNGGPSTDGDLVQQIFAEMNAPSDANPITNLPPARKMVQNAPNPNVTSMHSMDSIPPQAHIIGGHAPTPADFAHIVGGGGAQPYYMGATGGMQQQPHMMNSYMQPQSNNGSDIKQFITKELKTPILVAIIAFVVSLPVVNTMIAHYLPTLIRVSGDLTTSGLLLKAALAGTLFWLLQRVIVPLLI